MHLNMHGKNSWRTEGRNVNMTVTDLEKLRTYKRNLRKLKEAQADVRRAAAIASSGMDGVHVSGGHTVDRMAFAMDKLRKLDSRYLDSILRYEDKYQEMLFKINDLKEPESTIIHYRYLDGMKWNSVAVKTGLTVSSCMRIHKDALKHLGISEEGGNSK